MLCEENELLRSSLDHHPDVTKFAIENSDLKGIILAINLLHVLIFVVECACKSTKVFVEFNICS